MFTKRHFIKIAQIIRDSSVDKELKGKLIQDLANFFEEDNILFDKGKFYMDCLGD